jgi:predicted GIY-YIG superfamily endonuclease
MPPIRSCPHYVYILRRSDGCYAVGIAKSVRACLALCSGPFASDPAGNRLLVTVALTEGPYRLDTAEVRERELLSWPDERKAHIAALSAKRCRSLRARIASFGPYIGAIGGPPEPDVPYSAGDLLEKLSFLKFEAECEAGERV